MSSVVGYRTCGERLLGKGYHGPLMTYSRRRGADGGDDVTINDIAAATRKQMRKNKVPESSDTVTRRREGRRSGCGGVVSSEHMDGYTNGRLRGVGRRTGHVENMNYKIIKVQDKKNRNARKMRRSGDTDKEKKEQEELWEWEVESDEEKNVEERKMRGMSKQRLLSVDDRKQSEAGITKDKVATRKRKRNAGKVTSQKSYEKSVYNAGVWKKGKETDLGVEKKKCGPQRQMRKKPDASSITQKIAGTVTERKSLPSTREMRRNKIHDEHERELANQDEEMRNQKPSKSLLQSTENFTSNRIGNRTRIRTANAGNQKNAIVVDDILRTGDQPRVDEEVEVVEAFRQHVESEREEMMTALEQVKAEEKFRREEYVNNIATEAAKAIGTSGKINNGYDTTRCHHSNRDSVLLLESQSHPNRESTHSLIMRSHALISRYRTLKEKLAPILDFTSGSAEQQLASLITHRELKQEKTLALLEDLFAQAKTEISVAVDKERKRMRGVGKGMRTVEKWAAEYALG